MMWVWALLSGCLALAVRGRWLAGIDRQMAASMEHLRSPALDAAAAALTFFGSAPWTLFAAGIMAAWWMAHQRAAPLVTFLGAWALGLALQMALRLWVAQWRPDVMMPESPGLLARYDLAGFTSGHAFRSAFLYGWWARSLPQQRRWATAAAWGCGLLILLVGATRIYLRRHWFTDVIGAWGVAALALSAAAAFQRRAG